MFFAESPPPLHNACQQVLIVAVTSAERSPGGHREAKNQAVEIGNALSGGSQLTSETMIPPS